MANAYPTFTFTLVSTLPAAEAIGVVYNSNPTTVAVPAVSALPDSVVNTTTLPDYKALVADQVTTWLPGKSGAENANVNTLVTTSAGETVAGGSSFTLHGQAALYFRKTYCVGYAPAERAWFTVA